VLVASSASWRPRGCYTLVMRDASPSRWQLWLDVVVTRLMVWVAVVGKDAAPRPEVHLFLADRYSRLSSQYARQAPATAERLQLKAEEHYEAAGVPPLPPAVAVAMPVPRRPTFTDATGRPVPPPDEAA